MDADLAGNLPVAWMSLWWGGIRWLARLVAESRGVWAWDETYRLVSDKNKVNHVKVAGSYLKSKAMNTTMWRERSGSQGRERHPFFWAAADEDTPVKPTTLLMLMRKAKSLVCVFDLKDTHVLVSQPEWNMIVLQENSIWCVWRIDSKDAPSKKKR